MSEIIQQREPTSPGEILREEFLIPLAMTQKQLADHLGYDVKGGEESISIDFE